MTWLLVLFLVNGGREYVPFGWRNENACRRAGHQLLQNTHGVAHFACYPAKLPEAGIR